MTLNRPSPPRYWNSLSWLDMNSLAPSICLGRGPSKVLSFTILSRLPVSILFPSKRSTRTRAHGMNREGFSEKSSTPALVRWPRWRNPRLLRTCSPLGIRAKLRLVARLCLGVNVLNGRALLHLVLVATLVLFVLEREHLVAVELDAAVLLAQEDRLVAAPGDDMARRRAYLENEYAVVLPTRIADAKKAFADAELVFDATNTKGLGFANKYVRKTGNVSALMHCAIDNPAAFAREAGCELVEVRPFYAAVRRILKSKAGLYTRIAMAVTDRTGRAFILHVKL